MVKRGDDRTIVYTNFTDFNQNMVQKIVHVKEIVVKVNEVQEFGDKKVTAKIKQKKVQNSTLEFWNKEIERCESLELNKPTYVLNVQLKEFKGEFSLNVNRQTKIIQI